MTKISKRNFLKSIGTVGVYLAGANLPVWAINTVANASSIAQPYKLLKADKNGVMLMKGFTSRIVALSIRANGAAAPNAIIMLGLQMILRFCRGSSHN